MATNQGCKSMIPRSDLDAKFLFYFIKANVPLLESLGTGATFKELSGGKLASVEIPLPPLVEQKQIVALLDEAFAGIDEAKDRLTQEIDQVNTVLQSKFNETFAQPPITFEATRVDTTESTFSAKGRKATSRNIAGSLSLCVGKPSSPARSGWRWIELSSLAQLESGHTPSRAKPEYWNGNIPWISIRDAKKSHGKVITDTEECITDLGVENSSARILPTNTVCLSRTASVGYCTITGRPMATSQDFVNWVIKGDLHPSFLKFIFLAEGDQLLRFASGSVHQTIYYPETKAFAVCIPNLTEQVRIARHLEELTLAISQLRDKLTNKQVHLAKLKSSMLAEAFAGELTA
jgi:type I restriction enzyme S subunit